MWADGRTDMSQLIVAFRNFVNARKKNVFPKLFSHAKRQGLYRAFGLPPSALYFMRACDLAFLEHSVSCYSTLTVANGI